jgi:hypothetical protein
MSDANSSEAEKNIEIWKVKKLIKSLEAARGNGTSMISLIIREYCHDCVVIDLSNSICSAEGPSLTSGQDVGGRIRALPPTLPRRIDTDRTYRVLHRTSSRVSIVNPSSQRLHLPNND